MTIRSWPRLLKETAVAWDDQADQLHGARRNLDQADPGLLGSRVGPVAGEFLTTWRARVGELRQEAIDHAHALVEAHNDLAFVEAETVAEVQRLLPWADRDATPWERP